jgi:CheY-like chemotaxis protein
MKSHIKMSPLAPASPVQTPDTPSLAFDTNAEDRAIATRSEYSQTVRLEQNPSSAIAAENEEPSLIYVVDDEPGLSELYTLILEGCGFLVRAFNSRIEALAQLKGDRTKPDLLIMDYSGHAISVDAFMRRCLLAHPGLRILVASGFSPIDARFSYIRPDRFIQKPFTAEEFLREVEAALAV